MGSRLIDLARLGRSAFLEDRTRPCQQLWVDDFLQFEPQLLEFVERRIDLEAGVGVQATCSFAVTSGGFDHADEPAQMRRCLGVERHSPKWLVRLLGPSRRDIPPQHGASVSQERNASVHPPELIECPAS